MEDSLSPSDLRLAHTHTHTLRLTYTRKHYVQLFLNLTLTISGHTLINSFSVYFPLLYLHCYKHVPQTRAREARRRHTFCHILGYI